MIYVNLYNLYNGIFRNWNHYISGLYNLICLYEWNFFYVTK